MDDKDIQRELRRERAESMPSSRHVVSDACKRLGYTSDTLSREEARDRFNELLANLFMTTLTVLEEYEKQIDADILLPELVEKQAGDVHREYEAMSREGGDQRAFQLAVTRLLQRWHETLRGFFLSISQSRKQRGGKDFEYQIQFLLELAGIAHEVQSRRERADFILPSVDLLDRDRPKAVILSAKRTLKERWQEVVDELQRTGCPNIYLATTDEKLTNNVVRQILRRNIYLVVWDHVKHDTFNNENAVVSYSKFINDLTLHFLPQWH